MNPYLNWSTTKTSPQPMVLTPPSRCTFLTPRSSGTIMSMSSPRQGMASSTSVKDASEPSTTTTCATTRPRSSTRSTCADATTTTTKGHRRPRPVSASSDRRDCLLDRIAVMRQQETTSAYKTCHYFASANANGKKSSSTAPDISCRAKMVQWCTQVTDYCKFSRETVSVALSYVDRYLSIISRAEPKQQKQQQQQQHHHFTDEQRAPLHDRKEYQLLCMTALHTAIKIREPLEMDTETVAELSRGIYTAADVAWMEQQLLQVLGWRLAGPTSLDFCRHLVELAAPTNSDSDNGDRVAEAMVELCQLQTELASADYRFAPLNPSTVAVSSILNAIEALAEEVIVPAERLAMVETIRRVTRIDVSAKEIGLCRDELMRGLAGADADVANDVVAAVDSNDASCSSSNDGGTSKSKIGRRESIGSAEESPVSVVAAHRGCCA